MYASIAHPSRIIVRAVKRAQWSALVSPLPGSAGGQGGWLVVAWEGYGSEIKLSTLTHQLRWGVISFPETNLRVSWWSGHGVKRDPAWFLLDCIVLQAPPRKLIGFEDKLWAWGHVLTEQFAECCCKVQNPWPSRKKRGSHGKDELWKLDRFIEQGL